MAKILLGTGSQSFSAAFDIGADKVILQFTDSVYPWRLNRSQLIHLTEAAQTSYEFVNRNGKLAKIKKLEVELAQLKSEVSGGEEV